LVLGAAWGVSSNVPVPADDFTEFYEASYGRVVALVAAIVGERHQAEDIAQEAFARALTRWSRVARYDLPVEEVARDLDVSVGTVRTRLAAARQRLERELAESDASSASEGVRRAR
jgi:RNA polymerase sigma-70 factor (ECF subfamily)